MSKNLVPIIKWAVGLGIVTWATVRWSVDLKRKGGTKQGELNADLFKTAFEDDGAAILELIAKGANVNARHPKSEYTPLITAAMCDNLNAVTALIDSGADVNLQSITGKTALDWAVQKEHEEVISLLLQKGADPKIKAKDGMTALDYANKIHDYKVRNRILKLIEEAEKN